MGFTLNQHIKILDGRYIGEATRGSDRTRCSSEHDTDGVMDGHLGVMDGHLVVTRALLKSLPSPRRRPPAYEPRPQKFRSPTDPT